MEKSRKIVEYNADVKLYYTRDTTLKCTLLYMCVYTIMPLYTTKKTEHKKRNKIKHKKIYIRNVYMYYIMYCM